MYGAVAARVNTVTCCTVPKLPAITDARLEPNAAACGSLVGVSTASSASEIGVAAAVPPPRRSRATLPMTARMASATTGIARRQDHHATVCLPGRDAPDAGRVSDEVPGMARSADSISTADWNRWSGSRSSAFAITSLSSRGTRGSIACADGAGAVFIASASVTDVVSRYGRRPVAI